MYTYTGIYVHMILVSHTLTLVYQLLTAFVHSHGPLAMDQGWTMDLVRNMSDARA